MSNSLYYTLKPIQDGKARLLLIGPLRVRCIMLVGGNFVLVDTLFWIFRF